MSRYLSYSERERGIERSKGEGLREFLSASGQIRVLYRILPPQL